MPLSRPSAKGLFWMALPILACLGLLLALSHFGGPTAPAAGRDPGRQDGAPGAPSRTAPHADATAHNPNIQSFGDYHLEARVKNDGTVEAFVLDDAAKGTQPLEAVALEAEAQPAGEDPVPVTLAAKPLPGEMQDHCSRFGGALPAEVRGRPVGLTVTVPADGRSFRLHFTPAALVPGAFAAAAAVAGGDHAGDAAMPATPEVTEEALLFLSPGGAYTVADIAANGHVTASKKYAGMMARHSTEVAKGEPACPVTSTRADERFAWVVGGKTYLFCCPPCVAEFVRQAKENPATLKPPAAYVGKG